MSCFFQSKYGEFRLPGTLSKWPAHLWISFRIGFCDRFILGCRAADSNGEMSEFSIFSRFEEWMYINPANREGRHDTTCAFATICTCSVWNHYSDVVKLTGVAPTGSAFLHSFYHFSFRIWRKHYTGWWYTYPSEKYESNGIIVDYYSQYMEKLKKCLNFWNHQPDDNSHIKTIAPSGHSGPARLPPHPRRFHVGTQHSWTWWASHLVNGCYNPSHRWIRHTYLFIPLITSYNLLYNWDYKLKIHLRFLGWATK